MREETLCEILVARRTQLPDETATTMAFAVLTLVLTPWVLT